MWGHREPFRIGPPAISVPDPISPSQATRIHIVKTRTIRTPTTPTAPSATPTAVPSLSAPGRRFHDRLVATGRAAEFERLRIHVADLVARGADPTDIVVRLLAEAEHDRVELDLGFDDLVELGAAVMDLADGATAAPATTTTKAAARG